MPLLVSALVSGCGADVGGPNNSYDFSPPKVSWSASSPAWSPDGIHIAYSWYQRGVPSEVGIWIVDTSGVVGPQVLKGSEWHEMDWSPDGTHLAMTYSGFKGIYTVTTAGTELTPLSTVGMGSPMSTPPFTSTS